MTGRILGGAANLLGFIAGAALILMMLHIVADVTIRFFLTTPLHGTVEIVSTYYMVAVVFLPLALVERLNSHIVVELVTQHLGQRAHDVLVAGACVLSAAYFGAFTWQTWADAMNKYAVGEVALGTVAITVWPTRFFVPIGCAVIALYLLYKAGRLIVRDRSVLLRTDEIDDLEAHG